MHVQFDADDLEPLIESVLRRVIAEIEVKLPGPRIGYPESEAAALLGVAKHVLRDQRLAGRIRARKVGKTAVYARRELLRFLEDYDGG